MSLNIKKAARKKPSINDIDIQIAELKKRRMELQAKQAERLGRLAMAAGVSEFDISDEELTKAFEGVAEQFRERFRSEASPSKPAGSLPSAKADAPVSAPD